MEYNQLSSMRPLLMSRLRSLQRSQHVIIEGRVILNSKTLQRVKLTSGLYVIKVIKDNVSTVSKLIVN